MEKKLSVSVKKIIGQVNPKEGKWSDVLVFQPDDEQLEGSRGRLFAVLDLTGSTALDLAHFGRLSLEALRDEYYASKETSRLKALEEAIHRAQHRLVELVFGHKGAVPDGALNYNFAAAVLWGRVLYLAKFGVSGLYLFRNGKMEELGGKESEKAFSASGVVQDEDTIILGSSEFRRSFSVSELAADWEGLESLVANLGNPAGLSALTLRLELESVLGGEEVVVIAPVVKEASGLKRLLKWFSFPKFPKKLLLLIPMLLFLAATSFTISKRRANLRNAETKRLVAEAEQILADAEQYIDLNNSRARELLLESKEDFEAAGEVGGQVLGLSERLEEIETLLDRANKVKRVRPEMLEGATVSFDPLAELEPPPAVEGSVDEATYFDNVYFLVPSENQIQKSVPMEGGYSEPKYWVTEENPPLADAVSMAIDGFIYVLKSDGRILKFEKGDLVSDFGLKEFDQPLSDPQAIFTTVDSERLYILDAGNRRLVVTDKSGLYQSQYVYEGLADPTDLFVDEAAGAVYFLDGTKIFRVGM